MKLLTGSLLTIVALFLLSCNKNNSTTPLPSTTGSSTNTTPVTDANGKIVILASLADNIPQIFTVNPDGTQFTQLTHFTTISSGTASWSADHSKIVYTHNLKIYTMNADGTAPVQLTKDSTVSQQPHFSPDGKKILFSSDQMYTMNPDGTNKTQITYLNNSANNYKSTYEGNWSPDGSKIVFVTYDNTSYKYAIYSINTDGSNLKLLIPSQSPNSLQNPSYSPDGSKIILGMNGSQWLSYFGLFTANSDGSNIQPVNYSIGTFTGNAVWYTGCYSPSGSKIALGYSKDNLKLDVYIDNNGTATAITSVGFKSIDDINWQ